MSCATLFDLKRYCSMPKGMAGVSKFYAIAYKDLVKPQGLSTVYQLNDGMIVNVGVNNIPFIEVSLLKEGATLEQERVFEESKNTYFFRDKISMKLSDLNQENRSWLEAVGSQPVFIIINDKKGNLVAAGIDGDMKVTESKSTTGTSDNDFNGHVLTLTGTSRSHLYNVDQSLLPQLLSGSTSSNPIVRYGWLEETSMLNSDSAILSLQKFYQVEVNSDLNLDFTENSLPKFLAIAEPLSEPAKTKWYCTDLNKGNIGGASDLFGAPIIIGGYRVYITQYKTAQTQTSIQLRK